MQLSDEHAKFRASFSADNATGRNGWIEYEPRTHQSNMDGSDRAHAADLLQASTIVASFAYPAAALKESLPRKPLPKPEPLERPASEDGR